MYIIGNVIIGTYLPWDQEELDKVALAYARDPGLIAEYLKFNSSLTADDVLADAENGELDFLELETTSLWQKMYHGSAPSWVAYCGVRLGELDTTDHFPLSDLIDMADFDSHQREKAKKIYDSLPKDVRDVLPPFGVYVVWSSS